MVRCAGTKRETSSSFFCTFLFLKIRTSSMELIQMDLAHLVIEGEAFIHVFTRSLGILVPCTQAILLGKGSGLLLSLAIWPHCCMNEDNNSSNWPFLNTLFFFFFSGSFTKRLIYVILFHPYRYQVITHNHIPRLEHTRNIKQMCTVHTLRSRHCCELFIHP